jgi:hypothetical protein
MLKAYNKQTAFQKKEEEEEAYEPSIFMDVPDHRCYQRVNYHIPPIR